MFRQTISLIVVAGIIATAPGAQATPLNPEMLPKDAKWVIHVDYEAFVDSAIAERLRQNHSGVVSRLHQWFEENCGMNPRNDIDSITLFSDSYETHSGAAVLCGNYDPAKVSATLEKKRDVSKSEFEGLTFYTWKMPHGHGSMNPAQELEHVSPNGIQNDAEHAHAPASTATTKKENKSQSSPSLPDEPGDREVTAVLIDGKKAVLAGSLGTAKKVVQLLKGNEPTLKSDSKLLENVPNEVMAYGAAINLNEIGQHERPFPILKQHENIKWYLGQRGDEMFETLELVADRRSTAREMEKAMEGLIALGKLWAGDLQHLRELYDDTEITRTRRTVEVDWQGDVEDVMAALDELQPRFQAWRENNKRR